MKFYQIFTGNPASETMKRLGIDFEENMSLIQKLCWRWGCWIDYKQIQFDILIHELGIKKYQCQTCKDSGVIIPGLDMCPDCRGNEE